jgi:aminopeptidase N
MKRWCSITLGVIVLFVALTGVSCKKEEKVGCRYALTVEYREDTQTFSGAVKVDFTNDTSDELTQIKFNLYPNAYRKNALYPPVSENYKDSAYYAGESYGNITITSVNGAKSWSIDGVDENILTAELCAPLKTGDKVTLDISFVTELAKINHRLGVTARSVNLGNAFPTVCEYKDGEFIENAYFSLGDPFSGGLADYTVNLTIPTGYVLACSGEEEVVKALESKTKYQIEHEKTRDFACVISENYSVQQTQVGGTELKYFYYDDNSAKARLSLIKECFEFFSEWFGSYLYPTFSVVQTGFCYGGMEYPALVYVSDELGEEEFLRSIVHETAHQWWYGAVGSDQINEAWQDESLAEYSAFLFFDEHPAYGLKKQSLVNESLKEYRSYFSVYGSVFGQADTKMSRHLSEYSSEYEYRCLAYDKGVIMWDALQKSIGDKKFHAGLKNYYKSNKLKTATPTDLVTAFEKTGVTVKGLFDAFLSGKAVI